MLAPEQLFRKRRANGAAGAASTGPLFLPTERIGAANREKTAVVNQ